MRIIRNINRPNAERSLQWCSSVVSNSIHSWIQDCVFIFHHANIDDIASCYSVNELLLTRNEEHQMSITSCLFIQLVRWWWTFNPIYQNTINVMCGVMYEKLIWNRLVGGGGGGRCGLAPNAKCEDKVYAFIVFMAVAVKCIHQQHKQQLKQQ